MVCVLFLLLLLLSLSACANEEPAPPETPSETMSVPSPDEGLPLSEEPKLLLFTSDYQVIQETLEGLPVPSQLDEGTALLIDTNGFCEDPTLWNDFLELANQKKPCSLLYCLTTIEGDPIYNYLHYDGQFWYHAVDNSRDQFGDHTFYYSVWSDWSAAMACIDYTYKGDPHAKAVEYSGTLNNCYYMGDGASGWHLPCQPTEEPQDDPPLVYMPCLQTVITFICIDNPTP